MRPATRWWERLERRRGRTRDAVRAGAAAAALAGTCFFLLLAEPAWPQDRASAPPPPAIPVPEIAPRAEEVVASLKALDERLWTSSELVNIEARLPAMSERSRRQLAETERLLDSDPTLGVLTNLADTWREIAGDLSTWTDVLTREATGLEAELSRLNMLADQWARTREEARRSQAPAPVLQRIDATLTAIGLSRSTARARRAYVLSLQARLAQQLALVQDAQTRGPDPSAAKVLEPPAQVVWVALAALASAFVPGALGYMPVARFIGDGVLRSAYAAMLLYASVRVADGLLAWALRSWPLEMPFPQRDVHIRFPSREET